MKKASRKKSSRRSKTNKKITKTTSKAAEYIDQGTPETLQSLVAEALEVTDEGHLGEEVILRLVDCLKWHKHQRNLLDWAAAKPSIDAGRVKKLQRLNSVVAKTANTVKATVRRMKMRSALGISTGAHRHAVPAMESSGQLVIFPLLKTPMETNYRACTIPYRYPPDNPKNTTPTELAWINLFANSIPSFQKQAKSDDSVADATDRADKFAQRYSEVLEDLKKDPESHGGPLDCVLLYQLREQLLRELGFRDIFKKVKDEENAKAISLFEDVVCQNDAIEDTSKRVENLIRGIFAGNLFDLGSAELAELFSKDGMSFLACCQNLVPRPWIIDDLEAFISKWNKKTWKKAVIFVDNSGSDIILGILPFARELLRCGTQVVLAANELPSINDVTYPELIEIIAKLKDNNGKLAGVDTSNLLIANSGNDLAVIDLTRTSQELAYVANDADLVILEGMGRGIETNLYAQFTCDSLNIGMVNQPEVAQFLGGRLYDCVFKFNEVLV